MGIESISIQRSQTVKKSAARIHRRSFAQESRRLVHPEAMADANPGKLGTTRYILDPRLSTRIL